MQTWGLIGIAPALYGMLRFVFGPMPQVAMTVVERLDNEIYSATGVFVSGHNVKHVLAGVLLGCTLAWLLLREPSSPSGDRPQLS